MEAQFYLKDPKDKTVLCTLCPRRCHLKPGRTGLCHSRTNVNGTLMADCYMQTAATCVDPIEKKPLYHFKPGTEICSVGPYGCSLACAFCQNSAISQEKSATVAISPSSVTKAAEGTVGVAYTYAESTTWIETVLELATEVKKAGQVNVLVTNGFVEEEPAKVILDVVDAVNVDIKGFTDKYYWDVCRGSLKPVLDFCKAAKRAGKHIEVSFPLVEGLNDRDTTKMAKWIAKNLGKDTPFHILRCFPHFKMTQTTSVGAVEKAYQQARKQLLFVYTPDRRNTECPDCGKIMVSRDSRKVIVHSNNCCGHRV